MNNPSSDCKHTPLTDTEEQKQTQRYGCFMVKSDFARTLERELAAANERIAELEKDKARLDWLEACRIAFNKECGSSYGWEVVRSHNVNRIMVQSPWLMEPQAIDVNDFSVGGKTIRSAIDSAMNP